MRDSFDASEPEPFCNGISDRGADFESSRTPQSEANRGPSLKSSEKRTSKRKDGACCAAGQSRREGASRYRPRAPRTRYRDARVDQIGAALTFKSKNPGGRSAKTYVGTE